MGTFSNALEILGGEVIKHVFDDYEYKDFIRKVIYATIRSVQYRDNYVFDFDKLEEECYFLEEEND